MIFGCAVSMRIFCPHRAFVAIETCIQ
jgi:hypothetical protein